DVIFEITLNKTNAYVKGTEYTFTVTIADPDHFTDGNYTPIQLDSYVLTATFKEEGPVAPTVEATDVGIRERTDTDVKKDLRFVFRVTLNDSKYVAEKMTYGEEESAYEITAFGATLSTDKGSVDCEGKNIFSETDGGFVYTAVLKNISQKNWNTTINGTAYLKYKAAGADEKTVESNTLSTTVNDLP
ncbi:MAG: hypothetical protein K6G56_02175, partial [Clostridiales bacterium]|nr:hypothetical protein [Clostridiales bacterium]